MGGRGQRFVAIALVHLGQVCTRPRPFGCLVSAQRMSTNFIIRNLCQYVCLFVSGGSVGGTAA